MRYRLTALTPLLVGDGHKLAPIDYMVWKDQINVLDQFGKIDTRGPDFVEGVPASEMLMGLVELSGTDRFEARKLIDGEYIGIVR